jgi:hypothetical protein
LAYLFDQPNIFNVPGVPPNPFSAPPAADPNLPSNSFDAQVYAGQSGLDDSVRNQLGLVFTSLNFFYHVYEDLKTANELDANALDLALAIANDAGAKWSAATPDSVTAVLDTSAFTEIFRRLSGFLGLVSGVLKSFQQPATEELAAVQDRELAHFALERLIRHLNCNENYYIQQLLGYLAGTTKSQAIVDFVAYVLARSSVTPEMLALYDPERSFVSRQQVVVPGVSALAEDAADELVPKSRGNGERPITSIQDVELPADGIHMEVAAGVCILDDLPDAQTQVELSLQGGRLDVTAPTV